MSDHGKIHLLELTAISLEGVEKTMDAFGRVVHALHVAAHYIPPFALLLETIAGLFEVKGDLKKTHLNTVDKGTQILALSVLISIVAVGFVALGVAVLAPAMPFAYAAAAGVLTLATAHRFFLVKKDPKYKHLLEKKVELEKELSAILDHKHIGAKVKQAVKNLMINDKNVTYDQKKAEFNNQKLLMAPATKKAVDAYLKNFEDFSKGREEYSEFLHELSHVKTKTIMHSLFFSVGITSAALLFAGVAIATTVIPAFLATVAVGYIAYRTSPITKIKQFFSQSKPKEQHTVYRNRDAIINDLKNSQERIPDIEAHADQVMSFKDSRKVKYSQLVSKTGSHKTALKKVTAFKELACNKGTKVKKEVSGKLKRPKKTAVKRSLKKSDSDPEQTLSTTRGKSPKRG